MKKLYFILFLFISIAANSQFIKQKEKFYQELFAIEIKGQTEFLLPDLARVDIVTDTFAIEVDFGDKWAESIGQSLYYSKSLDKKPGVLLVVNGNTEEKAIKRLLRVARDENITVWLLNYNTNLWIRVGIYHTYSYKF